MLVLIRSYCVYRDFVKAALQFFLLHFRNNFYPLNYSLIMVRGPKKHMKRLAAPKSWMLEKLGGVYSCKPSSGPHKQGKFFGHFSKCLYRILHELNDAEISTAKFIKWICSFGFGQLMIFFQFCWSVLLLRIVFILSWTKQMENLSFCKL